VLNLTFPKVFVFQQIPLYLNYEKKRRTISIIKKQTGMKKYFLKTAGAITMLALMATGAFAQEETTKHSDDVIIIRPKTDVETKLTIEIKGEDVKINGKPLAEYKNDDVIISKRKQLTIENRRLAETDDALSGPRTRFRGGTMNTYRFDGPDNMELLEGTNTNKAFLGVGTEKENDGDGVTITSVSRESAAEKAGLKEGDIITRINDIKISTPGELTKAIGKFKPDEKITVTYKRDKKEQKATAVLTKRKGGATLSYAPQAYTFKNFNMDNGFNYNFSYSGKARLGLRAQETEDGKGLKVLGVDEESAAEKAGIKEGDVITTFDGTDVNNIDKLRELAKPALEKVSFKVKLTRDGKQQEVEVKIPKNLKSTSL
jgi:serine protease Do